MLSFKTPFKRPEPQGQMPQWQMPQGQINALARAIEKYRERMPQAQYSESLHQELKDAQEKYRQTGKWPTEHRSKFALKKDLSRFEKLGKSLSTLLEANKTGRITEEDLARAKSEYQTCAAKLVRDYLNSYELFNIRYEKRFGCRPDGSTAWMTKTQMSRYVNIWRKARAVAKEYLDPSEHAP